MVLNNSVLKVVSASTSLLKVIRHNKVREGCVYFSKVHSSKEAHASVTSSFLKWCPVEFSEELSSGRFPADTGNVKNHPCRSSLDSFDSSTEGLRKGVPEAGSIL